MICPKCKQEIDYNANGCYTICHNCKHKISNTEVYSRVVGFYRPIEQFNDGKREEYKDRKEYKLKKGEQKNENS